MAKVRVGSCRECGRDLRVKAGSVKPRMRLTCRCGAANDLSLAAADLVRTRAKEERLQDLDSGGQTKWSCPACRYTFISSGKQSLRYDPPEETLLTEDEIDWAAKTYTVTLGGYCLTCDARVEKVLEVDVEHIHAGFGCIGWVGAHVFVYPTLGTNHWRRLRQAGYDLGCPTCGGRTVWGWEQGRMVPCPRCGETMDARGRFLP